MRSRRTPAAAAKPVVEVEAPTVRDFDELELAPETQRSPETRPSSRLGGEAPPSPRCIVVFVVVPREPSPDTERRGDRPTDPSIALGSGYEPTDVLLAHPATADMTSLDWAFVG